MTLGLWVTRDAGDFRIMGNSWDVTRIVGDFRDMGCVAVTLQTSSHKQVLQTYRQKKVTVATVAA